MRRIYFNWILIMAGLWGITSSCLAVEYPIIGIGVCGGWAQNELTRGGSAKIFLRYSLEAYVPGFNVEIGYGASFYSPLSDSVIFQPDPVVERRRINTHIFDRYPMITGTFQLRLFGENTFIFWGGGAQLHWLRSEQKTTDRYWDDIAEKYQEIEIAKRPLLDAMRFGYHFLGGVRFGLGGFGSLDLEVRKTFLNVNRDVWDEPAASRRWGDKKWSSLNINLGLTVYIF